MRAYSLLLVAHRDDGLTETIKRFIFITLASIFVAIVNFVTPAAIIVALKAVYEYAKEEV